MTDAPLRTVPGAPIAPLAPITPIVQVDAFASRPFTGNPAAVCLLSAPRPADWMQSVAAEMNLSETAFLVPAEDGDEGRFGLRWFTPATEVALCGHATLASAHTLWESGRVPGETAIRFDTASGVLTCAREAEEPDESGAGPLGWMVWMDFPSQPATELSGDEHAALTEELAAALGEVPVRLGRSRFDLLVELTSEDVVRGLEPDMVRLAAIDARGIIVTAAADDPPDSRPDTRPDTRPDSRSIGHDFVSRFFGPRVGVPEDPVTGSAHCVLAPWWSGRLGSDRLTGYQASPRGGVVRVRLVRSGEGGGRVRLGGTAVTVFTGELRA